MLMTEHSDTPSWFSSSCSGDTRKSAVLEHVRFQSLQSLLSEISLDEDDNTHRSCSVEEKEKENPESRRRTTTTTTKVCAQAGENDTSTIGGGEKREKRDHDPKVLKKIKKMEKRAIALLEELENPPTSKTVHHQGPTMPRSAIRFSKYLVFLWQRKAGCVISYEWRYGFILYQSAPHVWSEPVFLKHRYMCVGATCGWSCGGSVFAISDDAAMIEFMKHSSFGKLPNTISLDCRYSNDSVNNVITCKSLGKHVTRYHIDSAASYIVDLSIKMGRESVDGDMHEALYGSQSVSARDILDGHVPLSCQNVMHDMYACLGAKGMRCGSIARETKQLFEEERKSLYRSMSSVQRRSSSCLTTKGKLSHSSSMTSSSSVGQHAVQQDGGVMEKHTSLFGDSQLLDLDLGDP